MALILDWLVIGYASPHSTRLRAKIFSKEKKKKKKVVLLAEASNKAGFFKKILPGFGRINDMINDGG
jgi:hypothetical protein